jgi:hypothetical protein
VVGLKASGWKSGLVSAGRFLDVRFSNAVGQSSIDLRDIAARRLQAEVYRRRND